jgi:glucose-6-phosphate isomerase
MGSIVLDYTHAMSDVVGSRHGVTPAELDGLAASSKAALAAVQARRTKDLRWLDLPYQSAVHEQVLDYASRMAGRFQNIVVCGIGGSALGTIALQQALNSPYHNLCARGTLPRLSSSARWSSASGASSTSSTCASRPTSRRA